MQTMILVAIIMVLLLCLIGALYVISLRKITVEEAEAYAKLYSQMLERSPFGVMNGLNYIFEVK